MNARSSFLLAALATLFPTSLPADAAEPGEISLGGEVVIRLRVPAGGLTLQQRGDLVQERIVELLAIADLDENDVTVLPLREGPTIYVRGRKFLTVDRATAEAAGRKPDELARAWARQMADVLPRVNIRLPGGYTPPAVPDWPEPPKMPVTPAKPDAKPTADAPAKKP